MLPASNAGAGMNMGEPDPCATPPLGVPVPYPNMAMHATMVPFDATVLVSNVPALNMSAEAPMTLGDQPGVMSPFMGPGRVTTGSPVVMVGGVPAVTLMCPTMGNDCINALGVVSVPAVTTVLFGHAGAPATGPVDRAALGALSRALDAGPLAGSLSPEGIASIAIPVFSFDVPARVHAAVARFGAERVATMIVDLRGCPGGDVLAAIELARDFLREGEIVAVETDGEGDETVHRVSQDGPYAFPVVVLVDGGTASAAELFAGALQAHGRALVVGERTHGKGTAQRLVPGEGSAGASYATVATFALASGMPIQGRGIEPDVALLLAR